MSSPSEIYNTRGSWMEQLKGLPTLEDNDGKIPSIFLAHGQPMLIMPPHLIDPTSPLSSLAEIQGPQGLLARFLRDLGPFVLDRYKPKAIVVFSAHWETGGGGGVVSDYGEKNPLLYDYHGFPQELYNVKFESRGDSTLSRRIVDLLQAGGIESSRLLGEYEKRGSDGRGFEGNGLDHGVFVPFKLMFGDECSIPIVQVSISSDLNPSAQRKLGEALEPLRSEGVLIVSGGLTIHTFRDFSAFSPKTAKPPYHSFERSIISAFSPSPSSAPQSYIERSQRIDALTEHESFRLAHPRAEHFIPLYIAAGSTRQAEEREGKESRVVCGLWGAKTMFFGV